LKGVYFEYEPAEIKVEAKQKTPVKQTPETKPDSAKKEPRSFSPDQPVNKPAPAVQVSHKRTASDA